jgi:hypothetical protein
MTSLFKRINELVVDEGWSRKEATELAKAELGTPAVSPAAVARLKATMKRLAEENSEKGN